MLTAILLVALVSGTAAHECNLKKVQRGLKNIVPFDANNQIIKVTTKESLGSDKIVVIAPRGKEGNNGDPKGDIWLRFSPGLQYSIGGCNGWTDLPVDILSESNELTWTISITLASEKRFRITCNNVEVLNVVLNDTLCNDPRDYWSGTITQLYFRDDDTASDLYCITEPSECKLKPAQRNYENRFPFDANTKVLKLTTKASLGSNAQVVIEPRGDEGQYKNPNGSIWLRFGSKLQWSIGGCIGWTDFPVEPPTANDKTWTIEMNVPLKWFKITCNNVEVLDVVLPLYACTDVNWPVYWSGTVTQAFFDHRDDATELYCVTVPWECDLGEVPRKWINRVPFDNENQVIHIKTEASLGSSKMVVISPRSDMHNSGLPKGDFWLLFDEEMKYSIGGCNSWTSLPVKPPTTNDKTWTISMREDFDEDFYGMAFRVTCNNVEVLNVVTDETLCNDFRPEYWMGTITQLFFDERDDASEKFCLALRDE